MIKSTIKSLLQADLISVWDSVTSLHDFSWRSDIISIEVFDEKHFKETSKDGYETSFTITWIMKTYQENGQDILTKQKEALKYSSQNQYA